MTDLSTIEQNILGIKQNMATACAATGRDPSDVSLIAVTKTIPLEILQACQPLFTQHDVTTLGENRVQELLSKYDSLPTTDWHMIGNLQRNKVKYIADKVSLIHSVDNLKLATDIDRHAGQLGKVQEVLLEVNIAAEASKHGVKPTDLPALAQACSHLPHLRVTGLMTVAPYVDNPEDNRRHFQHMARLLTQLKQDNPHLQYLSMGMTGDYTVAIEEGATMVRIGTGIFGARD